jgi:23S rRNA (pseudouridine1915-N3)-methyltransferase
MRLLLAAVGRARPGPELSLYDHYRRRLGWTLTLREVDDRRVLPAAQRMARESELLLADLPRDAVKVALDERGALLSSEAFALRLAAWRDAGRSPIAFLIGGADGHGDAVRDAADLILSLGPMTWPHMLARALLAEQLYRAERILAGHPYHRNQPVGGQSVG